MTRPAQPRRSNPTPAKTSELCVQIRPKIAATAKIKHAESYFTSHKVPNTPRGHNHPTVLQEALDGLKFLGETSRTITTEGLKYSSAEIIPANSIVMTS